MTEHTTGDPILAKNLKSLRVGKRLGQVELQNLSGVDRVTIYAAETRRRDLRVSTIRALANALGVSMGELLD